MRRLAAFAHTVLALAGLRAGSALAHDLSDPAPYPVSSSPAHSTATAEVASGAIDTGTALRLAAAGAKIVDVRTPQEFASGHLPGAVNIPHDEIRGRAAELGPPEAPVVLYCRSGRRTGIAAKTLRDLGYDKVYDAGTYGALAPAFSKAAAQ